MYCNIPTFICEVSYEYHMQKVQTFQVILVIVIQAFQYLSFLLPINGWGIWEYQENLLFSIQKISSYCLIVPIFMEQQYYQILFNFTVTLALGTLIFLTLAFFCYNFKELYINQVVYWIFLLSSNLFYLPLIYLFTLQIGCYINTDMDTCNQILNQLNILSIICLLLISIYNFCWHYFFCNFTFFPLNLFYQKFSMIAIVLNFLNVTTAFFNHANGNDGTIKYISLTLLHAIFLIHIKQFQTQIYCNLNLNKFGLAIFCCLEMFCIIISIVIFQEKQGLNEKDLAFLFLLFGVLFFGVVISINDRQIIKTDNLNNSQSCVNFVEIMYQHYQQVKDYKKQNSFFILNTMLMFHLNEYSINQQKGVKKIIYQFIRIKLDQFSIQNSNIKYEPLLLLYLSYLEKVFNKPLLGFVELRKYEILENEQSYFFTKMKNKIEENLKKEIERQQKKKKVSLLFQEFDRTVGQKEVHESLFLQQQILPMIREVLDYKIHLMTQQIQGFQNIYQFYRLALTQTQKMKHLQQQIELYMSTDLQDHISFSLNVIQLKILSIYYSLIMNDYHSSLICEKSIEEILAYDHSASNDIISNQKLLNNQVTLIKLSMIMDKGLILNKNKEQLAQYFEYDSPEFEQIKYIKDLMPKFFSVQHDSILSQYLTTAKSQYFEQFRQIFSKNKEGYLVSQQLSIDNDFSIENDYVLLGCIHQLKQSYDYILFSDEGKLLGMTKMIHQIITQEQTQQYTIDYLLDNSFVFIYFRQIIDLIIEYKKSLLSSYSQSLETVTTLFAFNKLHQIIEFQKKQILNRQSVYGEKQSSQRTQTLQQVKSQVESSIINNEMDENQGMITSNANSDQITFFDQIYQEKISQFIDQLQNFCQSKDLVEYTVRVSINRKTIGVVGKQKGYFIMEMQDIKKKSMQSMTAESMAISGQIYSSSMNNTTVQDTNFDQFNYSENEEPIKEICPPLMKQATDINQLLSAFSPRCQMLQEDHLLQNESGRDSYNLAPLSQRVNFINPSFSKQQQQLIERDFNDLQLQLEQEVNYSKHLAAQISDDKQSKEDINIPNDSSKQKSNNNILAIFKLNKTIKNQHEDQDNQKSASSRTSRTSGMSASQIIKNFQHQQTMPPNLKSILFLNLTLIVFLIIYILIMSFVIETQESNTAKRVDDLNGPMMLIKFYMKTYQLASALYLNALNLINNSNFIINECFAQLTEVKKVIVDQLFAYYDNFIKLDSSGEIQKVHFQYHNLQIDEVDFLNFYYLMLNLAEEILHITKFTSDNLRDAISSRMLDNLLLMRFNLDNLEETSTTLIDGISDQFYDILITKEYLIEIIVIVEIIVFSLSFYLQLFFWKSVQNYIQSIILIVGRISEIQQREQITRISFGKETLDKLIGKGSWMKTNYYKVAYLAIEDGKIAKSLLKSKLPNKSKDMSQQRKSFNTVLNHRILNTKTSILRIFLILTFTMIIINVYLVGVYAIYFSSQSNLLPTQHLSIKYIHFVTDLDSLITYGYILKTQPIYLEYFQEHQMSNEYNELVIDNIVSTFKTIFSRYDSQMNSIFQQIDSSTEMNDYDQKMLRALYESDFCLTIPNRIPYCQYDSLGFLQFSNKYGTPVDIDNDREFVSQGLIGIISKINILIRQSFDYELSHENYNYDMEISNLYTQAFNNAINEHFISTSLGTSEFFTLIQDNLQQLMDANLNKILIYIYTLGGILATIYCMSYAIWIIKMHNELKLIRMILPNLPIDILTEQHTLSQIKRLS